MNSIVSIKAYDGSIVRVPKDKVEEFKLQQAKIINLLSKGVSLEDIKTLIKNNKL